MTDRSKPRLVLATPCGGNIFAFEEYWTEDNDGFCSTDFLWEKHTRLQVFHESTEGTPIRSFDFDSGQREKEILPEKDTVKIVYWPSYQTRKELRIQVQTLEILEEKTEHGL